MILYGRIPHWLVYAVDRYRVSSHLRRRMPSETSAEIRALNQRVREARVQQLAQRVAADEAKLQMLGPAAWRVCARCSDYFLARLKGLHKPGYKTYTQARFCANCKNKAAGEIRVAKYHARKAKEQECVKASTGQPRATCV